jgi:hypothetical protein
MTRIVRSGHSGNGSRLGLAVGRDELMILRRRPAGAEQEAAPAAYDETWLDELCAELDKLVLANARDEFLRPTRQAATEGARR